MSKHFEDNKKADTKISVSPLFQDLSSIFTGQQQTSADSSPKQHRFLTTRRNNMDQLSDCNRISFFTSEFPTLPRKISEYLRIDFSSGANTRKIRGFHKVLNSSSLCLRGILSLCKKHHFGLRNGPFHRPKSTILHHEMGYFGP